VQTNDGKQMRMGRIKQSTGDQNRIPNGTPVRIDWSLGAPYIDGILPLETVDATVDNAYTVTDTEGHGGQDPILSKNMLLNGRAAGDPNDILPGDHINTSPDGAAVGALHGKVALIKGSPLAQMRCFGESDSVELISGNYRHITWMGESRFVNDDGHTSFIFKGGSDQVTQTGMDEERFTLFLDAGFTGNIFKLKVNTPQNQNLFEFHVSPEGKLSVFAKDGFNQFTGDAVIRVKGSQQVEISGTATQKISGDVTHEFTASRTEEISSNDNITVGQDRVERINRDYDQNIGGQSTIQSTGNITLRTTQGEGLFESSTGKTTIKASGNQLNLIGNTHVLITPNTGSCKIVTSRPDTIELGDSPTTHNTLYEPLEVFLNKLVARLNSLIISIAGHTHPFASGAVTPSPSLIPEATNLFTDNPSPAKSSVVKSS
jgi:hypothetical protein